MKVLLIYLFLIFIPPHPLHLSVTNITFESNKNLLKVSFRFFKDDFSQALQKNNPGKKSINLQNDVKEILQYLSNKIQIKQNKQKLEFNEKNCTQKSVTDDSYIIEFTWQGIKKGQVLSIENTSILELYPDQKHMIIFKSDNNEEGNALDKEKQNCSFKL